MTTPARSRIPTADPTLAQARCARWQRWRRDNGAPLMMSLPAILLLFVFAYLPMFGIILAFTEYRFDQSILGSEWIGLTNFRFLFGTDIAWRITRNTLLMNFLFIVTGTIVNILVALLMIKEQTRQGMSALGEFGINLFCATIDQQ